MPSYDIRKIVSTEEPQPSPAVPIHKEIELNYASDLEAPDRGSMANRGRIAGMSIQKESDENDYSDSNSHNERKIL